jgi:hypothetical protein
MIFDKDGCVWHCLEGLQAETKSNQQFVARCPEAMRMTTLKGVDLNLSTTFDESQQKQK